MLFPLFIGLCGWKCYSKPTKECGETILKEVLGKMEGKPHWPLVILSGYFVTFFTLKIDGHEYITIIKVIYILCWCDDADLFEHSILEIFSFLTI